VCLTVSRDQLQQRAADFRRGVLARAAALVEQCLEESLEEIDAALQECLVPVPRLGLPAGTPAPVVEAVRESLRQRAARILEKDRRVRDARAERARHRAPAQQVIAEPIREPAWNGIDTLLEGVK
jgi:hypothetical protein